MMGPPPPSKTQQNAKQDMEDFVWTDEGDDGNQWWSNLLDDTAGPNRDTPMCAKRGLENIRNEKDALFDPNQRGAKNDEGEGQLSSMAAMMLMTILYSTRVARFDLFKIIAFLAKRITRWDAKCDRRLHRLMCFVWSTIDDQMVGWIGDEPHVLGLHLFCDASLTECPYTMRSTSGVHLDVQGPNSRFPLAGASNQQTSIAQSSPEAEMVSLHGGLKMRGVPGLIIWSKVLAPYHQEDWCPLCERARRQHHSDCVR